MKKNGFTLVELLAVIVILGVLLLIAVPSVSMLIDKSKAEVFRTNALSYINAAKTQFTLTPEKYLYSIAELSGEKNTSPYGYEYIGGFVYIDGEKNAYIFLSDSAGNSIGNFDDIPIVIDETEVIDAKVEKIKDYNIKITPYFGTINLSIKNNETLTLFENGKKAEVLEKGKLVFLKDSLDKCNGFIVIEDNYYDILLVEKKNAVNHIEETSSYKTIKDTGYDAFAQKYSNINSIKSILSIDDLNLFLNHNTNYAENFQKLRRLVSMARTTTYRDVDSVKDTVSKYAKQELVWVSDEFCNLGTQYDKCYYVDLSSNNVLEKAHYQTVQDETSGKKFYAKFTQKLLAETDYETKKLKFDTMYEDYKCTTPINIDRRDYNEF